MTHQDRKKYNREYYRKNRGEILGKAKDKQRQKNVIPLFSQVRPNPILEGIKPFQRRACWGTVLLGVLAAANLYFLLSEMAGYYLTLDGHEGLFSAYLKALILEGTVIAFSANAFPKWQMRAMVFLIYGYTLMVLSASVIQVAFSESTRYASNQKAIAELETEIEKKISLRDAYFQKDRITLASRVDESISKLRAKLEKIRTDSAQSASPVGIWSSLAILILFRFLSMASNLYCVSELSRRYRLKLEFPV